MSELLQTPLADWHRDHGAKLVEFAGWEMPLRYAPGVIQEHLAVRQACGIFDVSHMGELEVAGPDARLAVDRLVTNNVARLEIGQVLYSALCRANGTVIDDVLVYCLSDDRFWIVCNAANHRRVAQWVGEELQGQATLRDLTLQTALFAIQGPRSLEVLGSFSPLAGLGDRLAGLEYYRLLEFEFEGHPAVISRTGYTGEKGYELYLPVAVAVAAWEGLLQAGAECGIQPIGLGARDTLRLEAGYSLYGHELDDETTPLEAGIGWVVKLKAGEFIGREALRNQRETGPPRKTIALSLPGRNIPRQGAKVLAGEEEAGVVTSGSFSPSLEHGIGLARVKSELIDRPLRVEVRRDYVAAEKVKLPFVPAHVRD
jgi:aminomethyltransferase